MAWYNQKDYPKIRALFPALPEFYDEWLDDAEERERGKQTRGIAVVRIIIEPAGFLKWCRLKEIQPDAAARRRYVRHGALLGRPPKN